MLKLRFKDNPDQSVWLVEPRVTLGVSPESDMVLSGVNAQMHHADILVEHEQIQLQLVSGAGDTFVNERRISDDKPFALAINDVVRICGQELELIDPKLERRPVRSKPVVAENTGWALKSNSTALSNRVYALSETTVVGRSNESDITLAAAHLSRRHASLHVKNGLLYVKDLGSSNGTYLNGERVTEARVKRGDELCFDTLSFGVIGPSDELDKTTVRSVVKPVAGKPSGDAKAASTGPKSGQVNPRTVVSSKPKVHVAVSKPLSDDNGGSDSGKSSFGSLFLGGILLTVAVAGAWWFTQR